MRLFHYTCADHGYVAIGPRGLLVPQIKPTLFGIPLPDLRVVWLTTGDFDSTGMDNSDVTICDRSAYRYVVTDTTHCVPWFDAPQRAMVPEVLEYVGDPREWWVSTEPVPVRLG